MLLNTSEKNLSEKIFKVISYPLGKDLTIPANNSPGTTVTTLPVYAGYTPIFLALENTYNGNISLWYSFLKPDVGTVNWRVQNHINQACSGVTIKVRILYVKSELFDTFVEIN